MKEFIDKILSAKYTGYIALILAIIIVIIAVYLISVQYSEEKDTSLNVTNVERVENKEYKVVPNESVSESKNPADNKAKTVAETKKEEKVEFLDSLNIDFKGKNVGVAIKYSKSDTLTFAKVKESITSKSTLKITLDQVLSIDLSKLNKKTLSSIKAVKVVIYSKDGKELFNSNVGVVYNKISIAVDTLTKNNEYYCLMQIISTDESVKGANYTFKF